MNNPKQAQTWKFVLGIALSLLALLLVARKIDATTLVRSLKGIRGDYALFAVVTMWANFFLRALRWHILLGPFATFGFARDVFPSYMVGYMANMLLPFKAGEVLRPYLLGRKYGVAKTSLLVTVVVERLMDLTLLAGLFALTTFVTVTQVPVTIQHGIYLVGGVAALGGVGLLLLAHLSSIVTWMDCGLKRLPAALALRLRSYLAILSASACFLSRPGLLASAACATAAVWFSSFWVVHFFLNAFSLPVPWYASIFVVVIANFGMMIPSSPGAFGVAHLLYVISLSLFQVDKSVALGVAVVMHTAAFSSVMVAGVVSLWRTGIKWHSLNVGASQALTRGTDEMAQREAGIPTTGGDCM